MQHVGMKTHMWQAILIASLMLCVNMASAEILFYDDFERLEVDRTKWTPLVSWGLKENDIRYNVLGRRILDVWGGGAGLSLAHFPEEFDYYADFNAKNGGSLGFIFHAKDNENFYMHEISTAGSKYAPQHIGWHINTCEQLVSRNNAFRRRKKSAGRMFGTASSLKCAGTTNLKAYLGKVGATME